MFLLLSLRGFFGFSFPSSPGLGRLVSHPRQRTWFVPTFSVMIMTLVVYIYTYTAHEDAILDLQPPAFDCITHITWYSGDSLALLVLVVV